MKIAGIVLAVLLVIGGVSRLGGGNETDKDASITNDAPVSTSSEAAPAISGDTYDGPTGNSSGINETVENSHVEAIGMEIIRNSIGNDVAVCTLEWTNLSERRTSAGWSITVDAYQNGIELGHGALVGDDRYDSESTMEDIEPGGTKTVQYCFKLDNVIELRVSKYLDRSSEYAAFQFDTGNGDKPEMNVGQGWVEFRGIDVLENSIGVTCFVVTANWTNYGAEADEANFTIFCEAYQNGRELGIASLAMNDAYDGQLVLSKIYPGVSTDVQYVFELEDNSPVDVKIFEYLGDPDSGVSQTFDVSGFSIWSERDAAEYAKQAEQEHVAAEKAAAEQAKKAEQERATAEEKVTTESPEQVSATPKTANYVLNTDSHKFHEPGCSSAKNISSANRQDVNMTRDEVLAMGYDPCGRCHP